MKVSLSFFLNFIIFISFGQTYKQYVDDSINKVNIIQEEKITEDKLIADFKNVDFVGLSKLIIQEIVTEKKKEKNIVFTYETLANEQRMLINTTDYVPTYNIENPVYNAKFFWTEENIQKIVKKWRKNLVPALGYEVFLNKNRESKEAFYLSNRDMKFYELVVNQKAGKFIKKRRKIHI
ncbi:hypothetical protein [Chryseobacterium foetidum]|uniref:hypothetical protein n=1 Tax=Chryseobacterium foetidum TaxID=2951057 RepID=UPI0021CA5AE0|nr:hypothetical protein [Chryseobacterium foetidum]